MKFPFIKFPATPQPAFPGKNESLRPVLPIILTKGEKSIRVFALVDSGADSCVFPGSLASQLGIVIPNPRIAVFSGTGNAPQVAFYEDVKVEIYSFAEKKVALSFDLYAGFCATMDHVGLGLLGQDGFFSRYKVLIDQRSNYIDIQP